MCCFRTEGGTWAASVGSLLSPIIPVPDSLVSLVAPHGLASVKIRVDSRIDLVEHVVLMGPSSVAGGSGTCADSTTAVTVRVDPGVGKVCHAVAVGAVSASRIAVRAGHAGNAGAGSTICVVRLGSHGTQGRRAEVLMVASAGGTHVVAAVAIRVDAGVSSVGETGGVRSVDTLGCAVVGATSHTSALGVGGEGVGRAELAVAGGAGGTSAHGVGAIAVRVDAGVSSVGDARAVRAVGAFRGGVVRLVAVRVDSLLDLVNDAGHVGCVVCWGVCYDCLACEDGCCC